MKGSLRKAVNLRSREDDEPVSKVQAVHALYELGLDDDGVRANRDKLAGRSVGRVRALVANLEGERPELVQMRLTQFARSVGSGC